MYKVSSSSIKNYFAKLHFVANVRQNFTGQLHSCRTYPFGSTRCHGSDWLNFKVPQSTFSVSNTTKMTLSTLENVQACMKGGVHHWYLESFIEHLTREYFNDRFQTPSVGYFMTLNKHLCRKSEFKYRLNQFLLLSAWELFSNFSKKIKRALITRPLKPFFIFQYDTLIIMYI